MDTASASLAGAMNDAPEQVSEAAVQGLYQRVMAEIAAIEGTIAHLRLTGGDDIQTSIAELHYSQTQLLNSLRDMPHAKHPKQLRSIAASIDIAIRHSTEARQHAQAGQDGSEHLTKQVVRAAALPVAGMVSLRFLGKPLYGSDYRGALTLLQQRGQQFLQGINDQFKVHAEAASRYMVDIVPSQHMQVSLLQHARDAYAQGQPAEAATRLSEAATLSLRDAERVHAVGADPMTGTLLQQAQRTAIAATRHAADQTQLDARRECTEQGKKDAELEACTMDGAVQRIDLLRVRMIRIQLQLETPEGEAVARVERLLDAAAHPEERQLQARKDALGAGILLRNVTITSIEAAQVRITPAETPGMAMVAPPMMNAY